MKEKHLRLRWPFRLSAVAVSMMVLGWTSCEKIKDGEKVDIIVPYYIISDGVSGYDDYRHSKAMTDDSLRNCAAHPYVRRIFIAIPFNFEQDFKKLGSRRISRMCSELSGKMAISPKISGAEIFVSGQVFVRRTIVCLSWRWALRSISRSDCIIMIGYEDSVPRGTLDKKFKILNLGK